jgi:malonyl-CoA O-methyltransferase
MNHFLIDKTQIRRAFSRAARDYDAAAILQREVCERMLERLDFMTLAPTAILDAGCGTGRATRQLAQRYPTAHITALDIALGMLEVTRENTNGWRTLFKKNRQHCVCADVETLPLANASMELIWSSLTLQWCNDLPAAFRELHRTLKSDVLFMFSTFGPDTLKELRSAFGDMDDHAHVNRFIDMHDIGDMLTASGFADPVMEMETFTLTYADVESAMRDLKAIGAHNAMSGRAQGLTGKTAWRRMVENYEQYRDHGKLPVTYEVVYGHAWKPQPKATADGRAIIKTDFKL